MKRILLLTEIFPPAHGGSGRWLSEIYARLPRGAVTAMVGEHEHADRYDAGYPHEVRRYPLASPEWGVRSRTGLAFYLRLWRELGRVAKAQSIDEVHCGRVVPEGVPAMLLKFSRGVPYTCFVHGEDVEVALTSREIKFLTRQVLRQAEAVVCNSENTYRILSEKWNMPDSRLVVMTPGVDTERFTADKKAQRPAEWQDRKVVLTVGRLQKRKGQDMMIRALPMIIQRFPDVVYVIVGGGQEQAGLEALVAELGVGDHVRFAGEVEDEQMLAYYQHCDLFALPNRRVGNDDEGFGMVLLEAQACGTAVLAGDAGGTRETMAPGETGVLVDCTRPEPLAEAVCDLLADPERLEAMGEAGRQRVEDRFSWPSLAKRARAEFDLES